ncbi:hypothetical protein C8Q76DRAFT_39711 [Earliella scabrosa]|nr:hypothetical protein C8Q76DRAFT_39711 [Earliella scabrosa]
MRARKTRRRREGLRPVWKSKLRIASSSTSVMLRTLSCSSAPTLQAYHCRHNYHSGSSPESITLLRSTSLAYHLTYILETPLTCISVPYHRTIVSSPPLIGLTSSSPLPYPVSRIPIPHTHRMEDEPGRTLEDSRSTHTPYSPYSPALLLSIPAVVYLYGAIALLPVVCLLYLANRSRSRSRSRSCAVRYLAVDECHRSVINIDSSRMSCCSWSLEGAVGTVYICELRSLRNWLAGWNVRVVPSWVFSLTLQIPWSFRWKFVLDIYRGISPARHVPILWYVLHEGYDDDLVLAMRQSEGEVEFDKSDDVAHLSILLITPTPAHLRNEMLDV